MNSEPNKFWYIILVAAAGFFAWLMAWQWSVTVQNIEELAFASYLSRPALHGFERNHRRKKPDKITVKALYLTAYTAGGEQRLQPIVKLVQQTELNALVIDIKDYSGHVLYDSRVKLVDELKLEKNLLGDVRSLINRLHEKGIYVIARQTVFQDPILALKKPQWAIKAGHGGLWRDYKGLAWVDPTKKEVWKYNLAIAKEAIDLGFDEINFDYMRFPSDGNMSTVVYTNNTQTKYQVMHDFFTYLSNELSDEPARISIDMFGYVMERFGEDDINIGQRLSDAVNNFDYVCPMMYPSHYPFGHLGLDNPAAHPALVIENGIKKGLPGFSRSRARLRPWIQAFDLGAVYDAAKIRAQIDTVEKYTDAGWMLWNASNRYSDSGLRPAPN